MLAHVSPDFDTTRTEDPGDSSLAGKDYHNNCLAAEKYIADFYGDIKTNWALNDAASDKIIEMIKDKKYRIYLYPVDFSFVRYSILKENQNHSIVCFIHV